MDGGYEKFRTTGQAAIKLRIAAEEFLKEGLPEEQKKDYGNYLQLRIRPAVELLIEDNRLDGLSQLEQLGWLPHNQMDDFLEMAWNHRRNSAFLWLLRLKSEKIGFTPRDFSL